MDELRDSSYWLDHFERNRHDRPEPDWARPTPFPPAVAAPLARSLAHFQLGESGEGAALLSDARRTWADDPDYVAALVLFVAEEQEHARLLEQQVLRLGGTLITRHWTQTWFRRVRRALGARFAVVTAKRRIWPWLDSGSIGAMLLKKESIRPGIRS